MEGEPASSECSVFDVSVQAEFIFCDVYIILINTKVGLFKWRQCYKSIS